MSNKLAWILGIAFFWEIVLTFYLYKTKRWKTFWLFLAVYFLPMFLLAHMVTFSMASLLFHRYILEKVHLPFLIATTRSYNYLGYARSFDPEAKELHDVILLFLEKEKTDKKLFAGRAKWVDGKWVFYDVTFYRVNASEDMMGRPQIIREVILAIPETLDDFPKKPDGMSITFRKKIKKEQVDEIVMQINQASSRGKTPDRPL